MGRLLATWRSWSMRRRLAVGGALALVALGGLLIAYLALKRPGDIENRNLEFEPKEEKKEKEFVNWPVYGYDDARSRYLPAKGVEPPFVDRFMFDAGSLLEFSPILVENRLYVMNKNAEFFALDSGNGKVLWKKDLGSLNASSPAYSDGRLFAVNLDPGQVVALRAKDGKRLWTRPLPGRSESSPVVQDGKVFFGVQSGDVFALDAKTGKDVWHIETAGEVKAGPALHNGTVYVGDYAGHMYAIRASDGAVRWDTTDLGVGLGRSGRFYSTPAVAFGRVYAGNADGRVYSFSAETGEIAWTMSTGAAVYSAPAVADTPDTPPTVYIGSADGNLYALNADSGDELWTAPVGGLISGAGSVVGDVVYVSAVNTDSTKGYAIKSGEQVFRTGRGEYNPVISDGRRIYLTGYAGITKLTPKKLAKQAKERKRAKREKMGVDKQKGKQEGPKRGGGGKKGQGGKKGKKRGDAKEGKGGKKGKERGGGAKKGQGENQGGKKGGKKGGKRGNGGGPG
jgi:outer membrane protein assembly factor BamB